jgi:anthranilate synthase component II
MRILLIDNYDSFTWNLVHLIGAQGVGVDVVRNDVLTVGEVAAQAPDAIVLSPGPCSPSEAGICLDVVKALGATIPIFGVCLGLQTIGQAYGGHIIRAPLPMHGKVSAIEHNGKSLFKGVNSTLHAARYHSLIIDRQTCPPELDILAQTSDGLIMAAAHRTHPVYGVQFHPESIASEYGSLLVKNFLELASMHSKVFHTEKHA